MPDMSHADAREPKVRAVKSWRLGADITTKTNPIARSDTTSRLPCIIPAAQPARRRDQTRETPDTSSPEKGGSAYWHRHYGNLSFKAVF